MATFQSLLHLSNATLSAAADHLWQSTLFAAAALLLTFLLRKHSARIRYAVWLATSLKFLLPFSFLVAVGSRFAFHPISLTPQSTFYIVEQITQPFAQPASQLHPLALPTAGSATAIPWNSLLFALWFCGFATALCVWIARWRRIAIARRRATPLTEGRELAVVRRLEQTSKTQRSLDLMLSPSTLEPGVVGIFRPVLLWPSSISDRLDDAHLEAVMAHELCHVRRQDNLAAAIHMLVESIFWFHPLVWWMGSRLIAEREQACDEAVIELGSRRETYAESILKVCEFCLSSPLTCVSGVTGADLKKRMVHIMTGSIVPKLNFTRKLLLWTAASLAIALPIVYGLFNPTSTRAETNMPATAKFSSVSIKPHPADNDKNFIMTRMIVGLKGSDAAPGFAAVGVSPHMLVKTAYRLQDAQLAGEPEWMKTEKYDIAAQIDPQTAEQMKKLPEGEVDVMNQQMMRQLLADYFKLAVHQQAVDLPVYQLVVGEAGAKMEKSSAPGMMKMAPGSIEANGAHMPLLTEQLSEHLGRPVIDKTGLQGTYSFTLHWTPDAEELSRLHATGLPDLKGPGPGPSALSTDGPSLTTAVEEQLGLKLQPQTTRVPVIVVDHIEKPGEN